FAGCTTFEDRTADTEVVVDFGGDAGLAYSPKCVRIKVGARITFTGDFATHPIAEACAPEGGSYFAASNFEGSIGGQFMVAGVYGYFCEVHGDETGVGMSGAFEVVP